MKKRTDNCTEFYSAFGSIETSGRKGLWDDLSFTDANPKMALRYVGWVDVMGASHMMRRSLDAASKNIGRLHEAVLKARSSLRLEKKVELHPMSDGVYVVAKDYTTVCSILDRVFRSVARTCLRMKSDTRLCPIRAAIAYGRVVNHNAFLAKMLKHVDEQKMQEYLESYCFSVLHGPAYASAHEAERHAPPFGIYHSESLREFGKTGKRTPITWPLVKWWCSGQKASEEQQAFATAFGQRLRDHFAWVESHPFDSGMSGEDDIKKIAGYKKRIEEYFGL